MVAGSVVVAVASLSVLLRRVGFLRCELKTESVIQGVAFAFVCVLWLMFASSFLFWVFPIGFLVSYLLGHALGGSTPAFKRSEIAITLICIGAADVASGSIWSSMPDEAMGQLATRLMAINCSVLVAAAVIRVAVRSFQTARKTASADNNSP